MSRILSVLTLALVGLSLNVLTVSILKFDPISDYAAYMKMATSMLQTGLMDDGNGNVAFYSAGYPLFMVPFFSLFGAVADVAQYVNAVLGMVSVILVFFLAEAILKDRKWAMIAAGVWAIYPPQLIYTEYLAKENLTAPLLLLQTLIAVKFHTLHHKKAYSLVLGLTFGFGLLVSPAILLTSLVIISVLLMSGKISVITASRAGVLGIFLIGVVIVLSPWLAYTNAKLGTPILNNNGSFNLYLGNNEYSKITFTGIQDTPIGSENWNRLRQEKGEVAAFAHLKDLAIGYILDNPVQTAIRSAKKIAFFWFPPIHEGKGGNESVYEAVARFGWLITYSVIMAFALIGLLFFRSLNGRHYILLGTIALYCAVHGAAYIIFRYRLPIMPLLIIFAIQGVMFALAWWRGTRLRPCGT